MTAPDPQTQLALPAELQAAIRETAKHSRSAATWAVYRRGWRSFEGWCRARGYQPLAASPDYVAAYLIERGNAGASKSDLVQRRAAISAAYEASGISPAPSQSPLVTMVMHALQRERRDRRPRKKAAVTEDVLRKMLAGLDRTALSGKRDAALLIVGQIGAFRRAELCRVEVEHLTKDERGYRLLVPWDKTDQEGRGRTKAYPKREDELCPVKALDEWLAAAQIKDGPLFRRVRNGKVEGKGISGAMIALVVKKYVAKAGLEGDFSGHSLRAGFITESLLQRIPLDRIQAQTFHKSIDVLLGYKREVDPYDDNAASDLAERSRPVDGGASAAGKSGRVP